MQEDDTEAMQDTARYARRIRRRLGLNQMELARRIDVPHETIRNVGTGEALPDRRGARLVAGPRQGSGGVRLRVLT